MPSLSSKDRVSLCRFTFADGRRCRTPRISTSPDFCFYHARKEAQFRASEKLSEDLAYFFSGDYLSANDLNTALSRVFVAVARGDVKPRAARTLAYLAQTMLQTLHLAQNEFISACGDSEWRDSVVNSINANYNYRFPSSSQSDPPQAQAPPQPPTPFHTPAPASALVQSAPSAPQPAASPSAASLPQLDSPANQPQPPVLDPSSPASHSASSSQPVALETCHPERSEGSCLVPAKPAVDETSPASASPESTPPRPQHQPSAPPRSATPTRDPYAVHYGPNCRLLVDGKLV